MTNIYFFTFFGLKLSPFKANTLTHANLFLSNRIYSPKLHPFSWFVYNLLCYSTWNLNWSMEVTGQKFLWMLIPWNQMMGVDCKRIILGENWVALIMTMLFRNHMKVIVSAYEESLGQFGNQGPAQGKVVRQ
ncbi:hypothetical protein P8452_18952 [Trifolium repens]|nr:hypothetical protein P8452_18952 [Trifolium repens]